MLNIATLRHADCVIVDDAASAAIRYAYYIAATPRASCRQYYYDITLRHIVTLPLIHCRC